MHSMEIKWRQCKHRGDHGSREKIDKDISIPCDKIITCHDKIRWDKMHWRKSAKSVERKSTVVTDCGSREKIDKKISVSCDKIITCRDKIRCTEEKVLSPLAKKYCRNNWALKKDSACGIVWIRKVMTKGKWQFLMNPKRFSLVLSNDSTVRIQVGTDLTLLKRALADRTGKFEGDSRRNNGIWHMTRSLTMGWRGTRDRTTADRDRWWRWLGLFTYFWMYYNMKVNIQSIHDIENAMN